MPSDAEIAGKLKGILDSAEFRPGIAERGWTWLVDAIHRLFQALSRLPESAAVTLIALSSLLLLVLVVRSWGSDGPMATPRAAPRKAEPPPVVLTPPALVERARQLIAQGLLRQAAASIQHALILSACQERGVQWVASVADWEWVRRLELSDRLIHLTRWTQRIAFGPGATVGEAEACLAEALTLMAPTQPRRSPE